MTPFLAFASGKAVAGLDTLTVDSFLKVSSLSRTSLSSLRSGHSSASFLQWPRKTQLCRARCSQESTSGEVPLFPFLQILQNVSDILKPLEPSGDILSPPGGKVKHELGKAEEAFAKHGAHVGWKSTVKQRHQLAEPEK